jgi:YVTN family beta-propeller protein
LKYNLYMRSYDAIIFLIGLSCFAQSPDAPKRAVTDPGVVTTRQSITPAGVPMVFDGRVYGVTFGKTADDLWILTAGSVFGTDWRQNKVLVRYALQGNPGFQGVAFDPVGNRTLVAARFKDKDPIVRTVAIGRNGQPTVFEPTLGAVPAGALALSGDAQTIVIPIVSENQVAVVDARTGVLRGRAPSGIAPMGVAVNRDGSVAFVTNWGGRKARPGDLTAPTGYARDADQVVVDDKGIASNGSVTRVDLHTLKATHQVAVGLHPTAIVWDESHGKVYVGNNNSDSVSVIDSSTNQVVRSIRVQPFGHAVRGIAPTALALTADGRTLFVACGGINAVAQVDVATGKINGFIPSGWYPNSLAISPDGKFLAIGSLLGVGSGWRDSPAKRFVHSYRGSVAVVGIPDKAQLAGFTTAVAENNHLPIENPAPAAARPDATSRAVPVQAGEPSPIDHVVFIIKENRTYDQVFGDIHEGNGDPSLVMFGEQVTSNQHQLARQFVLLDNFFATGGSSADGHQWLTQANETAYVLWQGYEGRSYPFDGSDPLAPAQTGFLWDLALARHKTVRVYGEYAGIMDNSKLPHRSELLSRWSKGEDFSRTWNVTAPIHHLNSILSARYPSYSTVIPDVIRAQLLTADIRDWDKTGTMPNLVIAALPSDHTAGTDPAFTTPRAMVADNDMAVGQIVEALTHTRFWKNMAIFIVEDDAQNGVDHVDGHRTVALAVSPYIRRHSIDSTFYSHQSILKTIELMLGLPTLSLFDLIANDMRASFRDEPDFSPYVAVKPEQSLFENNPPLSALKGAAKSAASASSRMRWGIPDAAPTERLNRILWGQVRGWDTPYPTPKSAVFAPLALDVEDRDK